VFPVVERRYSDDTSLPTLGIANLHAVVPGIEENKAKIERACEEFKRRGVTVAVFPEFCLSGYFWDDHDACWDYMEQAVTERHLDWIDGRLRPLLDNRFRAIVMNNLTRGPGRRFRNTTFVVSDDVPDPLADEFSYDKVFLPGIEKTFTESGRDDRLIVTERGGDRRVGFTTCYDYLFTDLLREYAVVDGVDAIIQVASWRAAATRDYPGMNVRSDLYYGELWDSVLPAASATNQVWTIACNAVGRHGISNVAFWGGSGIWAPSGLRLVQASIFNEELVIVHHLDIAGARDEEKADFDYGFDFSEVYRPMADGTGYTRRVPMSDESSSR
jgi:predicted amidohydrolase